MIEVSHLYKQYGDFLAVKDISFSLPQNQVLALIGLNGAGKTTILRMLTGFLSITKGSIKINSYDTLEEPRKLKEQIGYLPETPSLYINMKVNEFLSYMYRLRKSSKNNEKTSINNALEKTGLTDKKNHYIYSLSAGYKKRVGIAQAIVHNPEVLILDEPMSELDPLQIVEMRKLILLLKKNHTVLLSSHILSEISLVADKILFIKLGKVLEICTIEELNKKNIPLEEYFMNLIQN